MISRIKIKGFRGFATEQELKLSIPNGERGSGLTVIVGPNNGGKSTIIESFKLMALKNDVNFTEGQRNKKAGDKVEIVLDYYEDNNIKNISQKESLITVSMGGSEAKYTKRVVHSPISVLSSRRSFNPYLINETRESVTMNVLSGMLAYRGQQFDAISKGKSTGAINMLRNVAENPKFMETLKKIYSKELNWSVDLYNTGNHYVKIMLDDRYDHDSDGLGEGLVSLLFLVSFLVESSKDELIVIDEPELSLHPELQRNLLEVILDYTKDTQILYATHSPEMVSIEAILNGGALCRVVNQEEGSKIYPLNEDSKKSLKKFNGDRNNPHVLGYDARSCFFEADRLVVVEGQEDVILLNQALKDLEINEKIRFFGFGAGGANKIVHIATILDTLGFKKICCLYDGDREGKSEKSKVQGKFKQYDFELLNADDIRDKECDFRDKCKNIISADKCKICDYLKEGIDFCIQNKCENRRNENECEKCKHIKIGIFNINKKIKDKPDERKLEFENLLNRIAKKYGY